MHVAFALPSPARTGGGGGADYVAGLADGLRQLGDTVEILRGDHPAFPPGAAPVVDGMLLPSLRDRLPELTGSRAVALVHHAAAAAGRDDASRRHVHATLGEMLPRLAGVLATSDPVAERLRSEFGVAASVLTPGVHDHPPAQPDPAAPQILSVGVLTRRKGHDHLIRAAARLRDLPWRLVIAGDSQREPDVADLLRQLAAELGLADRVLVLADPAPAALETAWHATTVFALATTWEGYPAAVAEALARGIPVLVTAAANAGAILPPAAGLICPPDDAPTFGKCLRRLLFDGALRTDMAAAAAIAGRALPRWPDRARHLLSFLESRQ